MSDPTSKLARPAGIDDLKLLLRALDRHQVDYLLIGGYALYALGYQRGTVDIDIVLRPTREQGERTKRALLLLPDGIAKDLDPAWFTEGETIRVADAFVVDLMFDAFVVDLMFNACGQTYETLLPYAVTIDFEGVPVRTLNLEGLLKTKQTSRDKDRLDREVLERALAELKKSDAR